MALLPAAVEAPSRASTEELLVELRRRIIRHRDRRRETWDDWEDGLDSRGGWSEDSYQCQHTYKIAVCP